MSVWKKVNERKAEKKPNQFKLSQKNDCQNEKVENRKLRYERTK